jgi:hypothetical protein
MKAADRSMTVIAVVNVVLCIGTITIGCVLYTLWSKIPWEKVNTAMLPIIFLFVATGFAVLTSFVGLLSFCLEQRLFRIIYLVCVILLIGLQIAGSAISFSSKNTIINALGHLWDDPYPGSTDLTTRRIVERKFKCCGWKDHQHRYSCGYYHFDTVLVHECEPTVTNAVKANVLGTGIALIVLAVLELAPLIAAGTLTYWEKKEMGDRMKF